MNNTNQHGDLSPAANANLKECWWMQGGVVGYKLCDRDFDCEHCPFDQVLHGRATAAARARQTRTKGSKGCDHAGALFYHPAHTWVRIENGGCVRIGLDDFAVRILGRPYLITLPEPGTALQFGEDCWRFTHQAGVTVLVAPVSGRVREINTALAQRPALLSRDPYGEGWVLLIEPTDLNGCLKQLLYGPNVTQWYEQEFEKLNEMVSGLNSRASLAGLTMNDGGVLDEDFTSRLTADQLRQVIDSFFPHSLADEAETNKAILIKDRR